MGKGNGKLRRLRLLRFTAFERATFDLAAGVTTLIGENASGKSHVLKLAYVLNEASRLATEGHAGKLPGVDRFDSVQGAVATLLEQTFLPDEVGRLVRRAPGRRSAEIEAEWTNGARMGVTLSNLGRVTVDWTPGPAAHGRSVFVPTREVLSIFPGFVSAWRSRESSYDRTYYDLCDAMGARPLRGPRDGRRGELLAPLERALGGSVTVRNGRFYVRLPDGDMEAPLLAEGLRKIAMLAYLVVNGSLSHNAFLLWDEPEASVNPKLAKVLSRVVLALADWGVQVLLATHDYALASELSLGMDQSPRRSGSAQHAFLALGGREDAAGVVVERAARFQMLAMNPILEGLADLHDRELAQEPS
ncbi:MAG: ATP-binding protein [Deltaproteobacteria bacterium]|nr:ATP-binding protein [Deltaproteobacteria bacterium]